MAAVLCCSDSRVPSGLIFDQSLGALFVVRTAGLVLGPGATGSLEYAVAHLHVPLLVLKGHESCGAVTAAVEHPDLDEGHITSVVQQIVPAAAKAKAEGFTGPELVEVATNNFLAQLYDRLSQNSAIIREALAARRLDLVLTKYFLGNGHVEVLDTTL
jgi:carbonic anhydrase